MRVPLECPRKTQSSSVTFVGISKIEGPLGLAPSSPSARTRRFRLRASLISRWTRLSKRLTSVIMELTVSRRVVREARTPLRSSSRVVAGASATAGAAAAMAGAATTGAATTGATTASLAAAGLRPAVFFASTATGAATETGAATLATETTSSVFLATFLATVLAGVALIILVPLEEFMGNKRTARITVMEPSQFLPKNHSISEICSLVTLFFLKSAGT